MERREVLRMIAILTGGAVIGAEVFLSGCKTEGSKRAFSAADISLLDELGDTILPTTASSPGAKAAKIGEFMKTIVTDCYEEKDRKVFMEGIAGMEKDCKKKTGKAFMDLSVKERHDYVVGLDKEAKEHQKKKVEFDKLQEEKAQAEKAKGNKDFKKEEMPTHYFIYMKQLTLWGYFTSEVGLTKATRYTPVPGKYEGCVPYKKGDKIMTAG